jgi:glucosamine--fructose-6-phosphate aminotransferase (isomerizing)
MCGIFGYVGERGDAARLILGGLKKLEYRGYDSWGIAVAEGDRAAVDRRVGKIGHAAPALPLNTLGLGHTRWATHGAVTEENAHPHLDCAGRFAIVHNGIVSNAVALRRALAIAGHYVRSQTDTEVIAHLVEDEARHAGPGTAALMGATIAAFRKLQGLNAFAVLDAATGSITAAKNGSPLVIGFGESGHFLASDPSALIEHTRRMTFVDDGQAVLLTRERVRLFDIESGRELEPEIVLASWEAGSADRGDHPDYMTKEIHEQPELLRRLAVESRADAQALARRIGESDDVFVTGCGSAAHAALAAEHLFARAGHRVTAVTASEFAHLEPFVKPSTLVAALSQSGETLDVLDAVRGARSRGASIAAMTNVEGSSLWRFADLAVALRAGPERCVLATKSFTAKLTIVMLAAGALTGRAEAAAESIERAADDVDRMLRTERREAIRAVAQAIHMSEHLYVVGRGPSHALALEAALKIKEASYVHAEGFAGGELKHGVIALIEPGTPCIVLAPEDDTRADVMSAAMQVKARGATVIGLAPRGDEAFDRHIEVADAGDATAIANAVSAQLLGYDLARLRGHDPDMPRNLAKSVTVK